MPPAGSTGRVTVDELGRRFDRFEKEITADIAGVSRKIDGLTFVDRETLDTKLMLEQALRSELERRVMHLEAETQRREDETKANRRMAITGLVFPVLVLIVGTLILASIGFR